MADRPIASTFREGRPRMRSQSMYLSSHTPATPRTERLGQFLSKDHQQKEKMQAKVRKPLRKQINKLQ